jgi:hypothetical protein
MTLGEIAQYFNATGKIGATLTVVPVRGWRRSEWPSERGIGPKRDGQLLAPAFELCAATTLTCAARAREGHIISRWMNTTVTSAMKDRLMPGIDFSLSGLDYSGNTRSLVVGIENRDQVTGSRVLTAILSEATRLRLGEFTIDRSKMAELTGSTTYADAILAGEDSDAIIDKQLPLLVDFRRRVRAFLLYR